MVKKYNKIWNEVNSNKEFDSEPLDNEKYLKTKAKSYGGKINTNFRGDKVPKVLIVCDVSNSIFINSIFIDSIFKMGKNYYPPVFLEDVK